ncbi:MAG: hypothetical protein JNM21_01080 [Taibaiella sp.]|nr:hypothetical protein [Taibaiella sp.]
MRYLFLSLFLLLSGSIACLAQKNEPYLDTKPYAGTIDPPAPVAPGKPLLDTNIVRVAQRQAVSGFNITEFIASNFRYPPAVLEDSNFVSVRIIVEFIVEKDASVSGARIIRVNNTARTNLLPNTERLLKQEVMRVMRIMPSWQSPAYQNGEPVRSYFTLPISLRFE